MSPSKQERRRLAALEQERRQSALRDHAPLTAAALEELFAFVAQKVFQHGHDGSFAWTRAWLASRNDETEVLSFLDSQGITSDWDVLIDADPHRLFGPSPTRLARMPLEAPELQALVDHLQTSLAVAPCHNDLRLTRAWLDDGAHPVATVEFALIALGATCNCEVVLNVDLARIYPRGMEHSE